MGEPTTGLDPEARNRITALLADLVVDGTTGVQAAHDLDAARSADACLPLADGRLIGQRSSEEVLVAEALARIWQPA
ncbi:hypothetical protein YUWDRAFT_01888 [Streptomyces sp. AmelKG-D3]|nr:hypothetical protein YUWDRAFT_01888 [Streptomyces sp. AmelKG-D3]